jgi:hypothetical protein
LHAGDVMLADGLEEIEHLGLEPQMDRLPGPGDNQFGARPVGLDRSYAPCAGHRRIISVTVRGPLARSCSSRTDTGQLHLDMAERADEPSRWNTLRALRVLNWAGHGG